MATITELRAELLLLAPDADPAKLAAAAQRIYAEGLRDGSTYRAVQHEGAVDREDYVLRICRERGHEASGFFGDRAREDFRAGYQAALDKATCTDLQAALADLQAALARPVQVEVVSLPAEELQPPAPPAPATEASSDRSVVAEQIAVDFPRCRASHPTHPEYFCLCDRGHAGPHRSAGGYRPWANVPAAQEPAAPVETTEAIERRGYERGCAAVDNEVDLIADVLLERQDDGRGVTLVRRRGVWQAHLSGSSGSPLASALPALRSLGRQIAREQRQQAERSTRTAETLDQLVGVGG